jgi:hypothetical protein
MLAIACFDMHLNEDFTHRPKVMMHRVHCAISAKRQNLCILCAYYLLSDLCGPNSLRSLCITEQVDQTKVAYGMFKQDFYHILFCPEAVHAELVSSLEGEWPESRQKSGMNS